jgi:hypothetical protein
MIICVIRPLLALRFLPAGQLLTGSTGTDDTEGRANLKDGVTGRDTAHKGVLGRDMAKNLVTGRDEHLWFVSRHGPKTNAKAA